MAKQRRRSPNGENISGKILIEFDLDNDTEREVFEQIQKLTARRKLKPMLMGIFGSIREIEQHTRREMTPDEITISLMRSMYLGGQSTQPVSIRKIVIEDDDDSLPAPFQGSGLEADPSEVRRQLSESLADEFDDF